MLNLVVQIENVNGKNVVSSRVIAQQLGKQHKNVLKDIREKSLLKFEQWIIPNKYKANNGQEYDEYLLTKDGFTLYMFNIQGYNDFKIAYINRFNEREKALIHNINQYENIITPLENIKYKGNVDDLVYSKNGTPITTSRIIASKFNKEHREILRAIDNKLEHKNETIVQFCTVNIKSVEYLSENGQQYREYELTEQGFNFIALSLTGENADIHKIKFIESYHKIRETLLNMFKAKLIEEVLPQDNRNRQYIYIIKNNDTNRIKIGVAQNVEKRLKQLQTGSDSELSIVYRSNLCSNAFDVEKFMHTNFKDYHVRGEWFNLNETEIINELEKQNFVLKSEFIEKLDLKEISNNTII